MELWEILVPAARTYCCHQEWDKKISKICGGVSIQNKIRGRWYDYDEESILEEPMVVVRIACSKEQLDKIIDVTLEHYNQKAVMAYKISNEVIIKEKK